MYDINSDTRFMKWFFDILKFFLEHSSGTTPFQMFSHNKAVFDLNISFYVASIGRGTGGHLGQMPLPPLFQNWKMCPISEIRIPFFWNKNALFKNVACGGLGLLWHIVYTGEN